ncbi:MAG TPA: glycosyltransferase [Acidimicrobiales bacterium]|nr:glycosyltransferase [Acidimicrobiales bacterium]
MRVLHVTSSYPRWDADHVAPYLAELIAAQLAVGLEVRVLAPHAAGLERDGVVAGAPVHRFRYAPGPAEVLAYGAGLLTTATTPVGAAALPAYLAAMTGSIISLGRQWRPDVVHAHWWIPAGLTAAVAGRVLGAPLVITCHGSDVHLTRRPALARAAGLVLRQAAVVAAVSERLATDVGALLGSGRPVDVLRMPVNMAGRSIRPVPPSPPLRLAAVGRLASEKGFDTVISAVNRLVAQGHEVMLTIVGDGPLRRSLEALAAASGDAVSFAGAVGKDEMWGAIDGAHALVVPSRREGLGLVALDALARGRPVIASDVGGLPESVEDGADGVLVPPGDVEAWVAAILRLPLPPPKAAALGRHRPEAVAAAHASAYRRALDRRRP